MASADKRKAEVYFLGLFAGILEETDSGYRFTYDQNYPAKGGRPIGVQFPLSQAVYEFDHFPGYFANLVSEGWLRRIQSQTQRIAEEDRFGLLLANGRDLVGAVSIMPSHER